MSEATESTARPLRRVVARGSRFLHYCVDGEAITLCLRVGEYRSRYMPPRELCRRCVLEAHRGDYVLPR